MKASVWITVFGICGMVVAICGCGSQSTNSGANLEKPLTEIRTDTVQGHPVAGIRLLRTDGISFCGAYRADHGVVVCSHFDLQGLEKDGVAAAMAENWKVKGLKGELDANIVKVNALAAAKGVTVGMLVRDALALLMKPDAPMP